MRCPKCHYLSFDPEPRCRNCGYDLEVADADLALHASESSDEDNVPDLTLHERPSASAAPMTLELIHSGNSRTAVAELVGDDEDEEGPRERLALVEEPDQMDEVYEDEPVRQLEPEAIEPEPEPEPARLNPPARAPFRAPHTTTEMPLFVKAIAETDLQSEARSLIADDVPLVPPTRPPLAVRRGAPEQSRAQAKTSARTSERRLGPLDHDLLEDLKRVEREEVVREREHARMAMNAFSGEDESSDAPVEPRLRLAAAGIDVAVLGGIAAFVFWATLRMCNISVSDVGWAGLIPFMIFIGVMDLGYLLMFTAAGGQTVGKMAMHIRVVGDDQSADEPVPMGRAAWRAALTLVSVVVLGLGWLPALFGRGLTLHDRLAHTRVVRA